MTAPRLPLSDDFSDERPRGRVLGTTSRSGHERLGADEEGLLGIDHGALRIPPLLVPGWGRSAVAWGPFRREVGTTFAVFLLNGHNLSRTYRLESFPKQVWRWIDGAKARPAWLQLLRWALWHRPRETLPRKLRHWWRNRRHGGDLPPELRENLAVGFFPSPAPQRPLAGGNAFVVRASEDLDNGELCAAVGGQALAAFKSLQNVPVLYVVALRARGAVYYASGPAGARGLGGHPCLRPLAVDPFDEAPELWAGVQQAVLGEIGFSVDSRVYAVRVDRVAEFARRFGTAHAADALTGEGPLGSAEVGGAWFVVGELARSASGAAGAGAAAVAAPGPTGLLHALVEPRTADGAAALLLRGSRSSGVLRAEVGANGSRLVVVRGRDETVLAASAEGLGARATAVSVQVLDDGREVGVHADGRRILRATCHGETGDAGREVGFEVRGGWTLRDFEAHPREVRIPAAIEVAAPWEEWGSTVAAADGFEGPPGSLEGRRTDHGGAVWRRDVGRGHFDLTGSGAVRVRADPARPNPGRTVYAIDWPDPDFADLEVRITPPGTGPMQRNECRAGFCLWQDPGTYVVASLWLDHNFPSAAVSSFFCVRGFEDIFDAVWTNVGPSRVRWGVPVTLRLVCDGRRYRVLLDGEPVLHRSFADVYPSWERLALRKVGLCATWEWGNDTGSEFRAFTARRRG